MLRASNLNKRGAVLIVTVLILVILLFIVVYFLDLVTTGSKISRSYSYASQTYYLAEAGINEAIWKLKNDWADEFKTSPDWSVEYTRNPALYPNGSYTISVKNTDKAEGKITVTGQLDIGGGRQAQRIVKVKAFKALNPGPIPDIALYGNGEIFASASNVRISGKDASFFTNRDIWAIWGSDFEASGEGCNGILSSRNIVDLTSSLTADKICSKDECSGKSEECPEGCVKCPPAEREMPGVDFNEHETNSYLAQAQKQELDTGVKHVFTAGEISDLLWANESITLPEGSTPQSGGGIIYIDGDLDLKGGRNLTINGVLAVENSVNIGMGYCWKKKKEEGKKCGYNWLTINSIPKGPSGLLSKRDINIGSYISAVNVEGLVYANNELYMISPSSTININNGGFVSREAIFISLFPDQNLNITFDQAAVNDALQQPIFSPVITIDHWEEKY